MQLGEKPGRRARFVMWGMLGFLLLLALIRFLPEIVSLFLLTPSGDPNVLHPLVFLTADCLVGFGVVFGLWMLLISFQALLPISPISRREPWKGFVEAYRTAWHLFFHMIGAHGPAIFVKDGKVIATKEDFRREGPGVIVVDFNSAVVLEERNLPAGLVGIFERLKQILLEIFGVIEGKNTSRDNQAAQNRPRVFSADVVFTRPHERIRGPVAVDLRAQFRLQPGVQSYTRDGIELTSNIVAGFTIGQPPDILNVTFQGKPCPENIFILTLDEDRGGKLVTVKGFNDNAWELDEEDRKEIFERWQIWNAQNRPDQPAPVFAYAFTPDTSVQEFSSQRASAAVYAQAHNEKGEDIPWSELPTRVAAGMYREVMTHINYDDLYDVQGNGPFPLPEYKKRLRFRMRNNGILAYRLVFAQNGRDLVRGRRYRATELYLLDGDPVPFKHSKVLRDRGIKVTLASFGDPSPVNPEIYRQRLNHWRSRWQRDVDVNLASQDLQAIRVRSQARAEAQRDLWLSLNRIVADQNISEEAIALRILQALETAAADPRTRALLPGQTIDLMRHVTTLLSPQEVPPQPYLSIMPPGSPGPSNPPGTLPAGPSLIWSPNPPSSTPPSSSGQEGQP